MSHMRHALAATTILALCSSCLVGGGTRTVTALELRAGVTGYHLAMIDPALRAALASGAIWAGASETELYLSRGRPHLWWNTQIGQQRCRVFVHHGADPARADLAVTTCGGRVVGTNHIEPAVPCWRLADVGPRIAAASEYFDSRPLDTQWQIVIGLLHRGQSEQDVQIAFGEPHSRGFDEREDGKRAEKIVFLDRSGDAYGLDVTLIQNQVVAWQMPANRVLTPEAQQRRLDAVENRLTARIAEVEAQAAAQHAETVKLFNTAMARQDEMMARLTQPPSPPAASAALGSGPAAHPGRIVMESSSRREDNSGLRDNSGLNVDSVRTESTPPQQAEMGSCYCTGWPLGTDPKMFQVEHEKCFPNFPSTEDSFKACMNACQAKQYGVGHFRSHQGC